MKKKFKLLSCAFLLAACGGCAVNSGVLQAKDNKSFFEGAAYEGETKILAEDKTGSEQYRVFQQAATGYIPTSVVRDECEQQANKHCESLGKSVKLLQERTSVPPHILGNFPRAELLFICLPKIDISKN